MSRVGPMAGTPALSVEGISKSYPRRKLPWRRKSDGDADLQALRDVSFEIREGETLGLLGPNGAGKTTLLKIISTLLYPTSGRVVFYGQDVFENPAGIRGMLGLVTCDERSFYWRLTGRQNLSFFATLYGLSKKQATEKVETLLEVLDLTAAADRPYQGYSSGMKQKMAIARGLLSQPRLVLYDEPTRSLDPLSAQNIRRWIAENRAKFPQQTHLVATNQLHEAEQLCDRVLILNRGAVLAHGTIAEIRQKWQQGDFSVHRVTYRGFVAEEQLQPAPELGLLDVQEEAADGEQRRLRLRTRKGSEGLSLALEAIIRAGGAILACEAEQVAFDEVFCSLVLGDQPTQPAVAARGRDE